MTDPAKLAAEQAVRKEYNERQFQMAYGIMVSGSHALFPLDFETIKQGLLDRTLEERKDPKQAAGIEALLELCDAFHELRKVMFKTGLPIAPKIIKTTGLPPGQKTN